MLKSYKYRLYPNREQKVILENTLNTCRHLYNDALEERKNQSIFFTLPVFGVEKHWITPYDQIKELPIHKKDSEYLPLVHSQVLQNVLIRLGKSYDNFFRRVKNKDSKVGYPRFKGYNRYNSFTYPQHTGNAFKIINKSENSNSKKLHLSKIGDINIKINKSHKNSDNTLKFKIDKIKTCTIKRDIDIWFVVFTVEEDNNINEKEDKDNNINENKDKDKDKNKNKNENKDRPEKVDIENMVGIDVGINPLISMSNGDSKEPQKFIVKVEKKLKREQRKLSRKQKGSHNRNKQRIKVAKVHRKIRYMREDYLHKLSRKIVNKYDLIVYEDLDIKEMVKNKRFAKSISDVSWNILYKFTSYKAEWAGKTVEKVNPEYTSQECSRCGRITKKDIFVKTHICKYCGLELDRHINASLNILKRGLVKLDISYKYKSYLNKYIDKDSNKHIDKYIGKGLADFKPVRDISLEIPMTQEVHDISHG